LRTNLRQLVRYRGLIQSLVARELKARYRGSVLGFFWSFVNPLLVLLIYSFVFTVVMPGIHPPELEPYALFMFCGILPWTWFSSSLLEASCVLIAGGNLIRKVLFPAEVLPIVTVLAGLVHFCLGLPILAGFLVYYRVPVTPSDLAWFPVVVFVQLVLTLGLALLVAALTVHFRDVRGAVPAFEEVFLGEGNVDVVAAMRALAAAGFDGFVIDDHTPLLDGDPDIDPDWVKSEYAYLGRAHAIGYLQALVASVAR